MKNAVDTMYSAEAQRHDSLDSNGGSDDNFPAKERSSADIRGDTLPPPTSSQEDMMHIDLF